MIKGLAYDVSETSISQVTRVCVGTRKRMTKWEDGYDLSPILGKGENNLDFKATQTMSH